MGDRLAGKVSVITGAGQGIGRAAALAFATAGSTVWAVDRNAATLDTLQAKQPLIDTKVLDVTDSPGIARFTKEAGTIDVLFNCAGYVHAGSILDCTESDWDETMNGNVRSMFLVTKAFLTGTIDPDGPDNAVDVQAISLAVVWGFSVEWFFKQHMTLSFDALNPAILLDTTKASAGDVDATSSTSSLGAVFNPTVRLMFHMYF